MSNEPRKPDNGTGLEQDLGRLQDAWDRMERAEPPDLLDQAVRNAARRDLEPKRRARPLRWLGGFATATVAVLALTLMIEQEPQAPAPALRDAEGLRLEKQSAPARERAGTNESLQAPPPGAEPMPMKREARHPALPAESFSESRPKAADAPAMPEAALAEVLAEDEALPPPERWIEELLALKEAGKQGELEAGLEAFRRAYPDYPLPAGLTDSLP